MIFLGRRLHTHQWIGMGILACGLGIVGLASQLIGAHRVHAPNPMLGNLFMLLAQLVMAMLHVSFDFLTSTSISILMIN